MTWEVFKKAFDCCCSKGRFEIQDKSRLKKTEKIQVPSYLFRARDYTVSNPKPKKKRELVHQPRSQLVEGVERNTMVIVLRERIIFLVMEKVGTRFEIAQM